jgi:hypothetical protein
LHLKQKPSLVFSANGKKFAIEVETGSILGNKQKLEEKIAALKQFDDWFFVVTDSKLKKAYKQYGKTFGRFEVKKEIEKIFEGRRIRQRVCYPQVDEKYAHMAKSWLEIAKLPSLLMGQQVPSNPTVSLTLEPEFKQES